MGMQGEARVPLRYNPDHQAAGSVALIALLAGLLLGIIAETKR